MNIKQPARHVILEVSADYPESQFSLENEVIDIKDELENFTLLANVQVKIKSVSELSFSHTQATNNPKP